MHADRLATMLDYENYAKECLDMQTFEHLQGNGIKRAPETITDFDLIKLKALGLMSMTGFKGSPTAILSSQYESPICVGPLPALHDVKLALNGE